MKAVYAEGHPENFPVASILLPQPQRAAMACFYRFARLADDVADEGDAPDTRRLFLLNTFRQGLNAQPSVADGATAGAADGVMIHQGEPIPTQELVRAHRVATEVADIFQRHGLSTALGHALLDAFTHDVQFQPFATRDDADRYCRSSANPVGEVVLGLWGFRRSLAEHSALLSMSDNICTGLQWINFAQDLAQDFARGRPTVPRVLWPQHWRWDPSAPPAHRLVGWQTTSRADQQNIALAMANHGAERLEAGRRLPLAVLADSAHGSRRLALEIEAILWGGRAMVRKIRRDPTAPWTRSPSLKGTDLLRCALALGPRWLALEWRVRTSAKRTTAP